MAYEALALIQQVGGSEPDLTGQALARAQWQGAAEDARAEREAESRRAEREQQMEALAVVDRQLGGAMAEVRRHQSDLAGLTERVEDLRAQLAKAESKLGACRSSLTWWSERLELAQETVTRSATPNALEQAQMRAQDVLRQAHEDRDIIERARRNVRQRSGARPAHVRSEPTAVLTAADGPARYRIPGVPYAIGWVQ